MAFAYCNFKRKPVTKSPHRSLGDGASQATPRAAVNVWAEEDSKKVHHKSTAEKTQAHLAHTHSLFSLCHKCRQWELIKETHVPKISLWSALILRVHSFHMCIFSILPYCFPCESLWEHSVPSFCSHPSQEKRDQESQSFWAHTCPPHLGRIPTADSGASEDGN